MYSLSEIWIYPIKSLGGIRLTESKITTRGLEHDREFMLVDENGQFISQRTYPQLNQLELTQEKDTFLVKDKRNTEQIRIPITITSGDLISVEIWDDTCKSIASSQEVNQWFSNFLNTTCRLVFMPKTSNRQVDTDYAPINTSTTFTDGFPFLIIGQASLDFLNDKLDTEVDIQRFRPNFVFTEGQPHDEDSWEEFKIGNAHFKRVKPCARCVVTTINLDTSKPGKEPLKTLSTYRRQDNKIYFGQNLICLQGDIIKTGDLIH